MKLIYRIGLLMLALGLVAMPIMAQSSLDDICAAANTDEPETREYTETEQVLEAGVDYRAVFCTDKGAFYVNLLEQYAPKTVNNFVFLAQNGYYNNTTFHRVIEDFMVQGGDPTASGMGGPGYQFEDEFQGFLTFDHPGLLAMANAGPGTNGSQFFITTAETPHLNYKHSIFGEVLDGQDVVDAIELRDPASATEPGTSLNTVVIITDPAEVDSNYVNELEAATEETVKAAFAALEEVLPTAIPETWSFGEVDTIIPADAEALANWGEAHGLEFSSNYQLNNAGCDSNTIVDTLSYGLYAFPDADAALAALEDPFVENWFTSQGFSVADAKSEALKVPYYTQVKETCSGTEGTDVVALVPRGRFLALMEGHLREEIPVTEDYVLSEIIGLGLFEPFMGAVFAPELNP